MKELEAFYYFIRQSLEADGYSVHHSPDGCWFSWKAEGTGVETGEMCTTRSRAWATALQHRLENSHIMHTHFIREVARTCKEKPADPWAGDDAEVSAEEFEQSMAAWETADDARRILETFRWKKS